MRLTAEQFRTLKEGLEGAHKAAGELFAELDARRVADWGIINDGLLAKNRALALLKTLDA